MNDLEEKIKELEVQIKTLIQERDTERIQANEWLVQLNDVKHERDKALRVIEALTENATAMLNLLTKG